MWEQFMQMLSQLPVQNAPMQQMAAAQPQTAAAPPVAPNPIMDFAQKLAGASKDFSKVAGAGQQPQAPQVKTPQAPRPQQYAPGSTPNGLGAGDGGDIQQMLMGLPGIQSMMGQGAGGAMPQNQTGLNQQAGAGVPSLAELMAMGRR